MGGKMYQSVQTDIASITNTSVKNSIEGSILGGFQTMEDATDYAPIYILGLIVVILLGMMVGLGRTSGGGGAL